MKFVEIRDVRANAVAVNPETIMFISHDKNSNTTTFVFTNDKRLQTKMFRSVNEAVKWCKSTEVNTTGIGESQ